jgi:hypothetical protein
MAEAKKFTTTSAIPTPDNRNSLIPKQEGE